MFTYGLDRPLSGIGRYTTELCRALAELWAKCQLTLLTPFSSSPAGLDEFFPSIRIYGRLLPTVMLAGPAQIEIARRRRKLAIVHDPIGISPFLGVSRTNSVSRVVTIHDMIPYVFPETHTRLTNFLYNQYIPRSLHSINRIVTVSEASKRDIVDFFKLDPERVRVIYSGVSPHFAPTPAPLVESARARYGISDPYILTVGAIQARKNLGVLFKAFHALKLRGVKYRLVVVGKKAWKTDDTFRELRVLGLDDEVIFTGHVPDEDLPAIYSGAKMFIFPSLYEGFGLPPLEAMACGVPVITSNSSSLPEVVGKAGIMVDPSDVQGYVDAIERLGSDAELLALFRGLGTERAASFTWEQCAKQHVDLYCSLADEQRLSR